MRILISLTKYSDWLESYSVLQYFHGNKDVTVIFTDDKSGRVDLQSVNAVYRELVGKDDTLEIRPYKNGNETTEELMKAALSLSKGDVFAAPIVRYRAYWKLVPKLRKNGVVTVTLTEAFPESLGVIRYRWEYRMGRQISLKSRVKVLLTLPLAPVYARLHRPDMSFFPLYPPIKNPFVRTTLQPSLPPFLTSKKKVLDGIIKDGEPRTLLIAGFGYDLDKMVRHLGLKKYIATSKNKEIIVDGVAYPLEARICGEEILFSGYVDKVVGYSSSVMLWAVYNRKIEKVCYETPLFHDGYGPHYNDNFRRALKTLGIDMLPPCKEMMDYGEFFSSVDKWNKGYISKKSSLKS